MNIMRKLVFLVVILAVIVLAVGCQQSGLSEEEIRGIVEEEVARQLATMDELTVSNLFIENEDGEIVVALGSLDGKGMLTVHNADSEIVVGLSSMDGEGILTVHNTDGEIVVGLGSLDGEGGLTINNADGEIVIMVTSSDGDGLLGLYDKYGQVTFVAP